MTDALHDRLRTILAYKREEIAVLRRDASLADMQAAASSLPAPRDFAGAIAAIVSADGNALVCEMKRRSPSAGEINADREPVEAAQAYAAGGAACLSILTDGPSFGGSLADLTEVSAMVPVPVLRKDFMLDPIQVLEARTAGADAILIILAAVEDGLARELHAASDELGMSVLLEVHDEGELERALALPSPLIGVNNRNLRTFHTDLTVTERLAPRIPSGRTLVSESGVRSAADIQRLRRCGARAFLIGESLMRADNPEAEVLRLTQTRDEGA